MDFSPSLREPLSAGKRWRLVRTSANAQPAFGAYLWDEAAGIFSLHDVIVLTLRGSEIEEITAFLDPGALRHFGLPESIGSASSAIVPRGSRQPTCSPRACNQ